MSGIAPLHLSFLHPAPRVRKSICSPPPRPEIHLLPSPGTASRLPLRTSKSRLAPSTSRSSRCLHRSPNPKPNFPAERRQSAVVRHSAARHPSRWFPLHRLRSPSETPATGTVACRCPIGTVSVASPSGRRRFLDVHTTVTASSMFPLSYFFFQGWFVPLQCQWFFSFPDCTLTMR